MLRRLTYAVVHRCFPQRTSTFRWSDLCATFTEIHMPILQLSFARQNI